MNQHDIDAMFACLVEAAEANLATYEHLLETKRVAKSALRRQHRICARMLLGIRAARARGMTQPLSAALRVREWLEGTYKFDLGSDDT